MTRKELIKKIGAEIAKLSDNASQMCEEYEGYRIACQDISDVLNEITKEIQPSLPSNLDEAAEETAQKYYCSCLEKHNETGICDGCENVKLSFKAGAEWMAGQFQKIEGELVDWYSTSDGKDYCCGVKTIDAFEAPEGFYIRKKQ